MDLKQYSMGTYVVLCPFPSSYAPSWCFVVIYLVFWDVERVPSVELDLANKTDL